jgi:hypothetical protein
LPCESIISCSFMANTYENYKISLANGGHSSQ